jgi:tryptophan synthase beta chain
MDLILQEISTERYIEIPEEVREIYKLYRPTPLIRARRLEKLLGTPAHIYYKNEGVSPSGSHKPNTAIAQAFFNKKGGTKAMTTETGAGQWGSALAFACHAFDLDLEVYMVKVSYQQKPYRRNLMETYGAKVYASPTIERSMTLVPVLKDPNNLVRLALQFQALKVAATSNGTKKYGSAPSWIMSSHQSRDRQKSLKQMDMANEYPDVVIGCAGGVELAGSPSRSCERI